MLGRGLLGPGLLPALSSSTALGSFLRSSLLDSSGRSDLGLGNPNLRPSFLRGPFRRGSTSVSASALLSSELDGLVGMPTILGFLVLGVVAGVGGRAASLVAAGLGLAWAALGLLDLAGAEFGRTRSSKLRFGASGAAFSRAGSTGAFTGADSLDSIFFS